MLCLFIQHIKDMWFQDFIFIFLLLPNMFILENGRKTELQPHLCMYTRYKHNPVYFIHTIEFQPFCHDLAKRMLTATVRISTSTN